MEKLKRITELLSFLMMFLLYTTIKYKGSLQYWNKKYFQR
jgi:hypothetical protein